MTAYRYLGMTADPEELSALAGAIDASEDGWRGRVATLPRYVLTPKTLASEPDVIAERLRAVAAFLVRRRDGVPFGGYEWAGQVAAARERLREIGLPPGGRRRGRSS